MYNPEELGVDDELRSRHRNRRGKYRRRELPYEFEPPSQSDSPIEIPLLVNQKFRAILTSVTNLEHIVLKLECGNTVSCFMHNLQAARSTNEDLFNWFLDETVFVYVHDVIDMKLEVTLYDLDGDRIKIVNPDEDTDDNVEPLCPALVLRSSISGYVSNVEDNFIYLQPGDFEADIECLKWRLYEFYNEFDCKVTIMETGKLIAFNWDHSHWYRGKILSFEYDIVKVYFVDYGITDAVNIDAVRELVTQFQKPCELCLKVNIGENAEPLDDHYVAGSIWRGKDGWEGRVYLTGL